MERIRLTTALCFLFSVVLYSAISITPLFGYETSTGTKPELQTKQVVNATETVTISSSFQIVADTLGSARYREIAGILVEELADSFSVTPSIRDFTDTGYDVDYIVLGDNTNLFVQYYLAQHKRNTLDLGEEGFNLIALPNPDSPTGKWLVLIAGNSSQGVLRGVFSLVDLLADGTRGEIANLRVRDYPDFTNRDVWHLVGSAPIKNDTDASQWLASRKQELRQLASWGVSSVFLGRSDFWRRDKQTDEGIERGVILRQMAECARRYGLEAIPEIHFPAPHASEDIALWREGELVENEPFRVVGDSVIGFALQPVHWFDNRAANMDFETTDTSSLPVGWEDVSEDADTGWVKVTYGEDVCLELVGTDLLRDYKVKRTIHTANGGELQPSSFYVLSCSLSNVASGVVATPPPNVDTVTSIIEIGVFGVVPSGAATGCQGANPSPGVNAVDLRPWACYTPSNFRFPKKNMGTFAEDFYFWTPPNYASEVDPTYNGPQFSDIESIFIQITVNDLEGAQVSAPSVTVHSLHLEKRGSALRNVMIDNGLDFTITSSDSLYTYLEDIHYELAGQDTFGYRMDTFPTNPVYNNTSSIVWLDTECDTCPSVGDTLLVTCTVGVPEAFGVGGQATTYCLRSPGFLDDGIVGLLHDLYLDENYAFDPKSFYVRVDEPAGVNRCGRCDAFNVSNSCHFIDYVNAVQTRVDFYSPEARIVAVAGPMQPANIGVRPGYQFLWGGKWGESQVLDSLSLLSDLTFTIGFEHADSLLTFLDWPRQYVSPQQRMSIIGYMVDGTDDNTPEKTVETYWYDDNRAPLVGFSALGNDYDTDHSENEQRLMDYAWKRYKNPDATLHVREDGFYVAGDVDGDTVVVAPYKRLDFTPFGSVELRDPSVAQSPPTPQATIAWGDGSQDTTFSNLNDLVLSHAFPYGVFEVSLVVTAGGATDTARVTIDTEAGVTDTWSGVDTLDQDYTVEEGEVLLVEAGTNMVIMSDAGHAGVDTSRVELFVYGSMLVFGTASDPVTFEYVNPSVTNGWFGILVQDSTAARDAAVDARLLMRHCEYRNATNGIGLRNEATIEQTTIEDCRRLGLSIGCADSVYVNHMNIRNIPGSLTYEGIGVNVTESARVRLDSCRVEGAYWGALAYGNATCYTRADTMRNNESRGFEVFDNASLMAEFCVTDSCSTGVYVHGNGSLLVENSSFSDLIAAGVKLQGPNIDATVDTCTFDGNETGVWVSYEGDVTIRKCSFTGSDDEAISCIQYSHIMIDGNTIDGGAVGIKLDASSPTIVRNVVDGNTVGIWANNGADPFMDHCDGTCPSTCANANDVVGSTANRVVNLDNSLTVDAECNFWDGKHGGAPDSTWFVGVDYKPYLTSSAQSAPAAVASEGKKLPKVYGLSANYPNPFNPSTTVAYQVPLPGGRVSIKVFNVRGQLVKTLVNRRVPPGYHAVTWSGDDNRGTSVASGVYFVQMRARNFMKTRKAVMLK